MDNLGIISKYGYKTIAIFGVLFLLALIFGVFACFFLILLSTSLFVYRNCERLPASEELNAIISPIDGKIISVESVEKDGDKFTKLTIKRGLFSSGVLRAICDMQDVEISRRHGLFLCNFMRDSKLLNEKITAKFTNLERKFVLEVIAGPFCRALHFENFQNLKTGRRIGFILDGEVSLFLPPNSQLSVSVGEKIRACDLVGMIDE